MSKFTIAASFMGIALTAQSATPEWLHQEFSKGWNLPGASVENFLNEQCRTSGLDGIQSYAIQRGHGSSFNLHIYCRRDGSPTARYQVTMVTFGKGEGGKVALELSRNPKVRIGPFYFGDDGQPDGLLIVEQLQ